MARIIKFLIKPVIYLVATFFKALDEAIDDWYLRGK